jgi:uncharacterized protein (DUF1330 family)
MTAYAVAHVRSVEFGPDIVEYLQRIDATLDPFQGRFLVHGGAEAVEGGWTGDVIVIEFPDQDALRGWYDSPAYRDILSLRTDHMVAETAFAQGVPNGYRAADSLAH